MAAPGGGVAGRELHLQRPPIQFLVIGQGSLAHAHALSYLPFLP